MRGCRDRPGLELLPVTERDAQARGSECGRTVAGRRGAGGSSAAPRASGAGGTVASGSSQDQGSICSSSSLEHPSWVTPLRLHSLCVPSPTPGLSGGGGVCAYMRVCACIFARTHAYVSICTHVRLARRDVQARGRGAVSTPPSGWTPPGGSWSVPGATHTRRPPPRPGLSFLPDSVSSGFPAAEGVGRLRLPGD